MDTLGTLRILHNPAVWHEVAADSGTAEDVAAKQADLTAAAEASFVAEEPADASLPAYEGQDGTIYTRSGQTLPPLDSKQLEVRSLLAVAGSPSAAAGGVCRVLSAEAMALLVCEAVLCDPIEDAQA